MSSRLIGLTVAVALTVPAMGAAPPGETVLRAMEALTALLDGDSRPPPQLLEETTCIAVIPHVIKGAFVLGGRRGNGIISCRHDGGWTPHAFLTLSGASVGFQIGGESTDIVLLIVNERSVRSLLKSKFTLGADASVAAGPNSLDVQAATDARFDAEIYSYATSKGLFAGAAIDGARLALNRKPISDYYGAYVRPEDILFGDAPEISVPAEARRYLEILP